MIGILDIKLTKEFETLGFYISDHPLNQYKSIFKQYNIINYDDFENNNDILSSNIACTVLKSSRKKNSKRKFLCNSKIFRFIKCI